MDKIKMTTPLVEMDGDEMTRILWKSINHDKDIAARCKRVIELSDGEIAKGTN